MLITQEVKLELTKIDFVENPYPDYRGKFISYNFNMYWPLSAHFFNEKWPTSSDNDVTTVWGNSPRISYYTKHNIKLFKNIILEKIKTSLPNGFSIDNVKTYHLGFIGYDSPRDNRPWAIWYSARRWDTQEKRLEHILECRCIPIDKDFMDKLIALVPDKIGNKFTIQQENI